MKDSVSVIIPAFNEEQNVGKTITDVLRVLKGEINDWEIIVVNDGSIDSTHDVAASIARKEKRIHLIDHPCNLGIGMAMRNGFAAATKTYVTGLPGDGDTSSNCLRDLIRARTKADFVSSIMINQFVRSPARQVLSILYVFIMNALFGLKLKYFNGYFLTKRALINKLHLRSIGFSLFAEVTVKMIKSGATYMEVPFEHIGRKHGKSKSVTIKSLISTTKGMFHLIWDIYVAGNL